MVSQLQLFEVILDVLPSNGSHRPVETPPDNGFVVLENFSNSEIMLLLVGRTDGQSFGIMVGNTCFQVIRNFVLLCHV